MANEVKNNEIVIRYDGKILARAQSWSLSVNQEVIDVTTMDSGKWRDIISGQASWSASSDALVIRGTLATGTSTYKDLLLKLVGTGEAVELILSTDITGESYERGLAIITSLEKSGSGGEVLTYSVSWEGKGELSQAQVPAPDATTGEIIY